MSNIPKSKAVAPAVRLAVAVIGSCLLALTSLPQEHRVRIFLTGADPTSGSSSNVSAAEIGQSLDKHCPDVVLTIDQSKAQYSLQARNTGAGPARKPYKFTLFGVDGDRVFSTEKSSVDASVKDVCAYIQKYPPLKTRTRW